MSRSAPLTKTSWPLVIVAVIAGFVTAFNIGKIAPTLPLIQSDLGLSLAQSGWVVSSFSILAMLFSLMMAIVCMKYGAYRVAVISLTVLGTGAVGSSFAEGFSMLLGFRLLEGIGFVLLAVSMPALITSVTAPPDRPVAMAIWSTWFPVGISLILLMSPTLIHEGSWHSVWLFAAISVLFWLVVVSLCFWPHRNRLPPQKATISSLVRPLFNRATLLLMASFCIFASVILVLISFMPVFWLETRQIPTSTSSYWLVGIIFAHIFGNLASGWLVGKGVSARKLMTMTYIPAISFAALVFVDGISLWGQIACLLGFTIIGGIVPGTIFATIPRYVSVPAQVSLVVGIIFQGAATGQVIGPVIFGNLIDWAAGDWRWGSAYFLLMGVIGSWLMLNIPNPKARE